MSERAQGPGWGRWVSDGRWEAELQPDFLSPGHDIDAKTAACRASTRASG
jgi:hypothetical protein